MGGENYTLFNRIVFFVQTVGTMFFRFVWDILTFWKK